MFRVNEWVVERGGERPRWGTARGITAEGLLTVRVVGRRVGMGWSVTGRIEWQAFQDRDLRAMTGPEMKAAGVPELPAG